MTTRELNKSKKWMSCLKCGKRIHTDRCHRVCPKCNQKNAKEGRIRQMSLNSANRFGYEDRVGADVFLNS